MKIAPTFRVEVFISADQAVAKQILREFCLQVGLCVTVTPTVFVYTGGEEHGVRIGLVNYPRFPVTREDLKATAVSLAKVLLAKSFQRSALVVADDETLWIQREVDL